MLKLSLTYNDTVGKQPLKEGQTLKLLVET